MSTTDPWGTNPDRTTRKEGAIPTQRTWSPGDPPALPPMDPRLYGPDSRPLVVNVMPQHARAYVEPPNHVLHGLLTLATGGVWGIVWVWQVRKYRKAVRRG